MTDKEKLEKAIKLADAMYYAAQSLTTDASRLHKAMEDYHQFIINDYCKEEPASEDLEQAAESAVLSVFTGYADTNTPFRAEKIALVSRIFKAGAQWDREQMTKSAVIIEDELVMCYNNGEPTGLSPYKEWWDTPEVQSRFKDGDKVKVIIIKE